MKACTLLSFLLTLGAVWAASPALGAERPVHEAAKVRQRQRIEFPARPLAEGITWGKVIAMLEVDAFGELRDVLVVAYTHRDFADAVRAAVKKWRFTPGSIDGEPAGSILRIFADFRVNGVLAYSKPAGPDRNASGDADGFVYHPREVASLDRAPAALAQPAPIYPREWIKAGRTGSVVVEFYIDEEGRPRFPEVVDEADELLGVAATLAVKEWRFESPTHGGRAILVRARQLFNFRPPAMAGAKD